jgi:voltage-gated potassium channel
MRPREMRPDVGVKVEGWVERLTILRAVRTIVVVALALVAVAGLLEWLVEPKTFTSIGLAYWFAAMTVTTVGYGDIVPHTVAGRIIAVALMLVGFSLIPLLASAIVSVLVSKRSKAERAQADEERRENAAALGRIEDQLARMERASGQ